MRECSVRNVVYKFLLRIYTKYKVSGPQYNNRVDVRGHKYVFGPTQTHFSPSAARAKMSLRRAKNIFMPKNINCITIIISLKGNIRHKNIKIDCKQLSNSDSRLSASCMYFVVLLTVYLRSKKKRNSFSKYKKNE